MPKISEAHREMRRAQILDAAWRCFYREGVQATTMEQIIREADMSASAMYRYFSGKDDIIFSAITSSLTAVGKLLEPIVAQELSPTALVERVTADIEAFSERQGFNLASIAMHGWGLKPELPVDLEHSCAHAVLDAPPCMAELQSVGIPVRVEWDTTLDEKRSLNSSVYAYVEVGRGRTGAAN